MDPSDIDEVEYLVSRGRSNIRIQEMRTLCQRAIGRMNWCNGENLAEETRRSYGEECNSALPTHQMAGRVHVANSASCDFLNHGP